MELQVIQVIAKLDEPSHGKQGNKSKQKSSKADSVRHYHKSPLGNKGHQKCYQLLLAVFSHNDWYTGGWKLQQQNSPINQIELTSNDRHAI